MKIQSNTISPHLWRLPEYLIRGIRYHTARLGYTLKPRYSSLRTTRRCNSRCVMCVDWRRPRNKKELTVNEIGEIYSNRVFSSLKRISLSGGEPIMRDDLIQIAEVILDSCPQIKELMLITNGLDCNLVTERVRELLALCENRKLNKFIVSVSIDGYGDTHEQIRRVPGAFDKVVTTLKKLKLLHSEIPFYLCSSCAVQPLNIDSLLDLLKFGKKMGLPITLVPIRPVLPVNDIVRGEDLPMLNDEHIEKLRNLFQNRLQPYLIPTNALFWQKYFDIIGGSNRKLPCYLIQDFAEIDSDGMMRICVQANNLCCGNVLSESPDRLWYSDRVSKLRKSSKSKYCINCAYCCDLETSLKEEFFHYAGFWLNDRIRTLTNKSNFGE